MVKKICILLITMGCVFTGLNAQLLTPEQYVEKYKSLAIKEMKRMGVPAAITLAQGLLETENGNSDLVKKSNNHFGIKCKSSWTAEGVNHDDDAPGECFRSYKDAESSYRDHSNYLRGTDRYAALFALDPTDYKAWAWGLRKAGYATNPKYPDILIKNIEQYNLQQYSLIAAKDVPKIEAGKYQDDKEPVLTKKQNDKTPVFVSEQEQEVQSTSDTTNFINGHKYVYAKSGTSLLAIATENSIELNKLLAFNDLENDGILKKDQVIFLQKKSKESEKNYAILKPLETPYDVAQENGIQLKYILTYNQLTENATPPAGTKLYLNPLAQGQQPDVESNKAVAENVDAPIPVNKIHEVQAKEGLYSIAKKYQVSVQQLREWNNLTTDELKIGQQLIVSK